MPPIRPTTRGCSRPCPRSTNSSRRRGSPSSTAMSIPAPASTAWPRPAARPTCRPCRPRCLTCRFDRRDRADAVPTASTGPGCHRSDRPSRLGDGRGSGRPIVQSLARRRAAPVRRSCRSAAPAGGSLRPPRRPPLSPGEQALLDHVRRHEGRAEVICIVRPHDAAEQRKRGLRAQRRRRVTSSTISPGPIMPRSGRPGNLGQHREAQSAHLTATGTALTDSAGERPPRPVAWSVTVPRPSIDGRISIEAAARPGSRPRTRPVANTSTPSSPVALQRDRRPLPTAAPAAVSP